MKECNSQMQNYTVPNQGGPIYPQVHGINCMSACQSIDCVFLSLCLQIKENIFSVTNNDCF